MCTQRRIDYERQDFTLRLLLLHSRLHVISPIDHPDACWNKASHVRVLVQTNLALNLKEKVQYVTCSYGALAVFSERKA